MWPDLMITVLEVGIHFRELGPRAGVDGGGGGVSQETGKERLLTLQTHFSKGLQEGGDRLPILR